jgi:hypothetical protein
MNFVERTKKKIMEVSRAMKSLVSRPHEPHDKGHEKFGFRV